MLMDLRRALRLERGARTALVGAGGKTTALFQLARAFESPVVVTASTHLGEWQSEFADRHFIVSRPEDLDQLVAQVEGVTLFTGPRTGDRRLGGLEAGALARLNRLADHLRFPILIEADGSRQRPLKAPADYEPVIPEWANQVVVVAGLSGLGKPLNEETVYRPELFGQLSGVGQGEFIDEEGLARLLAHPQGGLKNIPPDARRSVLLNHADNKSLYISGMRIANKVNTFYTSILITNLNQHKIKAVVEPTSGIILAGGGSKRFGQPKTLLSWRGKALVRHATEAALAAGLDPVVIVLGAAGDHVKEVLEGLEVRFVNNPDWQAGQSTSVQKGLLSLPDNSGAAVFLLADQPAVTKDVVVAMISLHQQTLAEVIAPRVAGKRANPVLFDRDTFPNLLQITGDTGGRAIFDQYPISYVDWEDEGLLFDIDTPEDYRELSGVWRKEWVVSG